MAKSDPDGEAIAMVIPAPFLTWEETPRGVAPGSPGTAGFCLPPCRCLAIS